MKATVDAANDSVRLLAGEDAVLEAVQGAAHVLSDRAWALLERGPEGLAVTLTAKEPADAAALSALGALFERLVADQALRRRLQAANRSLMEYVVSRALVPAAPRQDAGEAPLTADQQAEIDKLIAEAETEISELQKKGGTDPLGIRRTWEERNER